MMAKKQIQATIYPDRGIVELVKLYESAEQSAESCTIEAYNLFKQRNEHRIDFIEKTSLSLGPRVN